MVRLGDLELDPALVLAPMAGITDRDFRLLIRRLGGCGLVSMEFISSEGLTRQKEGTLRLLQFVAAERPLAIQIYGADPARMANSARIVEALGADVCDINMGCPANKVLRGCAGAALGGNLPLAAAIVRAVRGAVRLPVTVKFRLGLHERAFSYLELGRICEDEGATAVTLHPRTARQHFSGRADWEHIARLKRSLRIPVIGNGDVTAPEDAHKMQRETGCDAVMIGRASLTNPWIFRQAAAVLKGEGYALPTLAQRHALIHDHFLEVVRREDERSALHKLRKFTGWYTHGLPEGRRLRRLLSQVTSAHELIEAVERFFAEMLAA